MTGHVSALELDALALGALAAAEDARVRAHLEGCSRCRDDAARGEADRAHFTAHLPRRPVVAPRVRWPWLVAPVLAAAAVVALVLWPRGHQPRSDLAIKGDATWQVFANRDGETFEVHDGTTLAAGDRIRFVVTLAGASYLLVASIDGAGATTIYYPYGATASGAVGGARYEVPGSIVLDAAPGPERLYAILSDAPIAASLVADQLRAIGEAGSDAIRAPRPLAVEARAQLSLVFEKAVQ